MRQTQKITFTAMFIALGLLLPMAFHAVGAGKVFLPMHIPILLAGFLVGPWTGLIAGAVTPLLSSVLTGMPPMMPPIAPVMVFELAVYGLVAGMLYRRLQSNMIVSLVVAMLAGRVVSGLLNALLLPMFGFDAVPIWAPLTVGVTTSWPGIVIQLIFIPLVVSAAENLTVFAESGQAAGT